jgi:hypothetical protein
LFKRILANNQDDIISGMIRKTKGDPDKLAKVKDFLLDYKGLLSTESLATLGVTENVE